MALLIRQVNSRKALELIRKRRTVLRQPILVAIGLFVVCSSAATHAQGGTGSISGTVVDERGASVSGAQVNVSPIGFAQESLVRYVETDSEGYFSIDRLIWGTYKVFAMKPASDYPNIAFSFYGNNSFPEATITPAAPSAKVRIRLGPKAGILSGSVRDADTGAPVNAGFKLIRAASPNDWLSTSEPSSYRVLVPPATDVLIQVSAPGYKTWTPSGPLRLQSGKEMYLDIPLQPSRNLNLPSSEFLIPDGYVGWLEVECNVKTAPATAIQNNIQIFKFTGNRILVTSSGIPAEASEKRYLYYTKAGATRDVLTDYRGGNGMVWGAAYGFEHGVMSEFHFFVGTEEKYKVQGYRGLVVERRP